MSATLTQQIMDLLSEHSLSDILMELGKANVSKVTKPVAKKQKAPKATSNKKLLWTRPPPPPRFARLAQLNPPFSATLRWELKDLWGL